MDDKLTGPPIHLVGVWGKIFDKNQETKILFQNAENGKKICNVVCRCFPPRWKRTPQEKSLTERRPHRKMTLGEDETPWK